MTYRLDELGWLQFEMLVQALMKAWLGPGVESWAGNSDLGRDCYCASALQYPGVQKSEGPFVFQAKFVAGANAAGAKFESALIKAVSAEAARILARIEDDVWDEPAFYILVTNCPTTAMLRGKVASTIAKVCPKTVVSVLGSADINALLASHPEIRRSFPQLLGLADLQTLLHQQVEHELLENSAAATALAKGLEKVFVPTAAFEKARAVLSKHHFVVLEGPPEMGKTAIARVMGLLRLLDQWEVYECATPGDFFKAYEKERKQFFIADDAFGRTEYDPSLGKRWEQDLEKVLVRLDVNHELCWTSRKHILERALRKMDLQGNAAKFPKPSAVLVDASKLDLREKTLMLLRHAKAACCSELQVRLVRKTGRQIVQDPHFTPERIRRFVTDILPNLPSDNEQISDQVRQAISDPTASMRKSFVALSPAHRLLLFCLLEQRWLGDVGELEESYKPGMPIFEVADSFGEILEELLGSFLKEVDLSSDTGDRHVDWIHPSVRDLVIEHLMNNSLDRGRFLSRGGVRCFALALSQVGGSEGKRVRPLLRSNEDWQALSKLTRRVIEDPMTDAAGVLSISETASEVDAENLGAEERWEFEKVIHELFSVVRARSESDEEFLSSRLYRSLCELSIALFPSETLPSPIFLWKKACQGIFQDLASKDGLSVAVDAMPFLSLLGLLGLYEPRFLMAAKYPECMSADIEELVTRLKAYPVTDEEYSVEDRKDALRGVLRHVRELVKEHVVGADWGALHQVLDEKLEDLKQLSDEEYEPEDVDETSSGRDHSAFTPEMIDSVLADLEPAG